MKTFLTLLLAPLLGLMAAAAELAALLPPQK
jgi:hypothetical protein